MDIVAAFHGSLTGFTATVAQVDSTQWADPTPCSKWDVRTLVNHVVSEIEWVAPLLNGSTIAEVGDRFDGDRLGDDPASAARAAAASAARAADEPDVLNRTTHLSFGDTPSDEYLHQITADLAIHTWDLATALGVDGSLDLGVVDIVADWFGDRRQTYREAGLIDSPAPVASNAGPQDSLIAAFGRDPQWIPPE